MSFQLQFPSSWFDSIGHPSSVIHRQSVLFLLSVWLLSFLLRYAIGWSHFFKEGRLIPAFTPAPSIPDGAISYYANTPRAIFSFTPSWIATCSILITTLYCFLSLRLPSTVSVVSTSSDPFVNLHSIHVNLPTAELLLMNTNASIRKCKRKCAFLDMIEFQLVSDTSDSWFYALSNNGNDNDGDGDKKTFDRLASSE